VTTFKAKSAVFLAWRIRCRPHWFCFLPATAQAMHIAEGFLPFSWAVFLRVVWSLPSCLIGMRSMADTRGSRLKLLAALAGAFTSVLSA